MKKVSFLPCYFLWSVLLLPLGLWGQTTLSGGTITTNTTWTKANSPYIIENTVTVHAGVTLTIAPGVVAKFRDHFDHLTVNGRLVAQGTVDERIVHGYCRIQLEVYGSNGQLIERLLDQQLAPGAYLQEWRVSHLPAGKTSKMAVKY